MIPLVGRKNKAMSILPVQFHRIMKKMQKGIDKGVVTIYRNIMVNMCPREFSLGYACWWWCIRGEGTAGGLP